MANPVVTITMDNGDVIKAELPNFFQLFYTVFGTLNALFF